MLLLAPMLLGFVLAIESSFFFFTTFFFFFPVNFFVISTTMTSPLYFSYFYPNYPTVSSYSSSLSSPAPSSLL
jgi:hypothetical protein